MTRAPSCPALRRAATSTLAMLALASAPLAAPPQDDQGTLPSLRTFTQKQFGGPCKGRDGGEVSGACLLDQQFAALFPNGLILGDQDGPDGDGEFALVLTSAPVVASFLPKTADPTLLTRDFTDPSAKVDGAGGAFAGQLVAAKLNLALARAGALGEGGSASFSELTLGDGVVQPLRGRRFAELVALGDAVISGAFGRRGVMDKRLVDVDGDGTADTTPEAVFESLKSLNNSFAGGRASRQVRGPAPRAIVVGPGGAVGGEGTDVRGEDREPGHGRGPVNARGRGKGLEQAREKHGLTDDDAADDVTTRKLDLLVDLTRSEGAPERARGQLQLRADPEQGRQRLDLSAYGLGSSGSFTAFVERTPASDGWVLLGALTRGRQDRDEEDAGPEGWHLVLDTRDGDPVPEGLTHVADLIGRRVAIRAGERPVLGARVPAPKLERADDGRDDEARGGMGRKDDKDGQGRDG